MIPSSRILLSFASYQVLEFYRCFDKYRIQTCNPAIYEAILRKRLFEDFHWGSREISNTFDENVKAKKQSEPNASGL